jgi:hypothetical protein
VHGLTNEWHVVYCCWACRLAVPLSSSAGALRHSSWQPAVQTGYTYARSPLCITSCQMGMQLFRYGLHVNLCLLCLLLLYSACFCCCHCRLSELSRHRNGVVMQLCQDRRHCNERLYNHM